MQFRTTGTRLASAVTAVLAVTALGAGTLATAPAALAAPAGPVPAAAAEAAGSLPVFPEGTELGGVGVSGFLSHALALDGGRTLSWTPFDGGAATPVEVPEDGGWTMGPGDVVVIGDADWSSEFRTLTLRDMAAPGTPDVVIDLAPLNGNYVATLSRTSVLAQLKRADGTSELHIVTKDGAATTTREVTGLPADAGDYFGSSRKDGSGAVVVGYEKGSPELRTGGRAVIDPVAGAAIETYGSASSGYGWGGPSLSDSHVGWYEYDEDLGGVFRTVDRATREVRQTALGAHDVEWYSALAGGWLVYGNPSTPPKAVSLTSGETVALGLDSGSVATTAQDGAVVLHGSRAADGKGLFRIVLAADGTPAVTKIADENKLVDLRIEQVHVPDAVNLDRNGGEVTLGWTLSHREAAIDVTITHTATEQAYRTRVHAPAEGNRFSFTWDGTINGIDAPNGQYAVEAEAMLLDGTGEAAYQGRLMRVGRAANPHDFTDNGATDVLARDAAGVLWRDELRGHPVDGKFDTVYHGRVGGGWNTYKQIEAVGNIGGSAHGDLIALDGSGVLWSYAGKGDGTFATRVRVGGGWGVYNKLAGGSDLDGDGRPDLLATDASGVLWFYRATGNASAPFAARVRVGGGWGIYNHLTAVGNIAGTAAGDLVARDTSGVLWLYQGDGRGNFLTRVRVGGGWGGFSQLVGAGDLDKDGRPDLIAYGTAGTYVYRSNGTVSGTFTRMSTYLYWGRTFTARRVVIAAGTYGTQTLLHRMKDTGLL
ncbi:FG-GAP-like repeat-containing protein, partial [Streptomyces sp. NPDC035033]|uniref:FG-GAP-like repeat-containing protein n=1 Tax=Streptomyces sp. NPDC035033 TaxID=3155368 RepID=UPI0033E7B0EC